MHPREGWSADGTPPRQGLSRRSFLTQAAGAGLLAGGLGPLLAACGSNAPASSFAAPALPRPSTPVSWPIYTGNKPIASGLAPERGATLQLYNWVAYINDQCLKDFGKKYGCKVQVTTFNTMSEALAKLRTGQLNFDVFFPTVDVLGSLIQTKMIQPLNHSYIPNISQTWPDFTSPFYDGNWEYTVPYTIYTTGIAWRKDKVPENPYAMPNGYAMPWQAKYRGKVAILDDYRESISLGLMKNGLYDLNTTDPNQIARAKQSLLDLAQLVNVHIDNNDYSNVPSGQIWIHHAWSGDIAGASAYLPKGVPVDVLGYWFPSDGKGPVANDTMVIPKSARNPVLAHLFLNYMLDLPNVLENISFNGYMQPLTAVTPKRLVKEGLLPPNLMSTAVLPSYFGRGVSELQLPATADAVWNQAWLAVSNGV